MSATTKHAPAAMRSRWVAVLAAALAVLSAPAGRGATPNAPTFFNNYFLTGDYVVSGVGMKGTGGANGFSTKTINVSGVPENATPVAAFLYWGTVVAASDLRAGLNGATFETQGHAHPIEDFTTVLNDPVAEPPGTSPCWSTGGGAGDGGSAKYFILHRADVLRFFEFDNTTKQWLLNGPHKVTLRDSGGTGNTVPFTLGASLVIVYREVNQPFSAIVMYDGGFVMNQGSDEVTQKLEGFYHAAEEPSAKLSVIIGEGQSNFSEQVLFNNDTAHVLATNPFISEVGAAWDNPTFLIDNTHNQDLQSGLAGDASAIVTINHDAFTPYDCLSGGAFIFRTTIEDDEEADLVGDRDDVAGERGARPGVAAPAGQIDLRDRRERRPPIDRHGHRHHASQPPWAPVGGGKSEPAPAAPRPRSPRRPGPTRVG
jgi:hypothetical protein